MKKQFSDYIFQCTNFHVPFVGLSILLLYHLRSLMKTHAEDQCHTLYVHVVTSIKYKLMCNSGIKVVRCVSSVYFQKIPCEERTS
jgi:uncharacterized membrane protein SirB2